MGLTISNLTYLLVLGNTLAYHKLVVAICHCRRPYISVHHTVYKVFVMFWAIKELAR